MTSDQLSSICDHNTPLCVGGITSMGTPHIPSIPRTPIHTHMYHPLGRAWEAPICLRGQTPKLKHAVHGLELKAETDFFLRLFLRGSWNSDLNLSIYLQAITSDHNCWDDWFFLELSLVIITLTSLRPWQWPVLCFTSGRGPGPPATACSTQLWCAGGQWGVTGHNAGLSLVTCGTMLASDWLMETCVGTIGAWSQESESFRNTLTQKYMYRWGSFNCYAVK